MEALRLWPAVAAVAVAIAAAIAVALAVGCQPRADPAPEIGLRWTVAPDPPATGPATFSFQLTDERAGRPVAGARVQVTGDMAHPGMTPVLAAAREVAPGRYEARLDLTMAGDWILLLDAALADGRTFERQVELRGVR